MDSLLRKAERNWGSEPTLQNWIQLLRVAIIAGQPRFTRDALVSALGPGEVVAWEDTKTGFKAEVRNGVYPSRIVIADRGPRLDGSPDLERVLDTTNWEGTLEVAWRDDDDDPELRMFVNESWLFENPDNQEYRFHEHAVTDDVELAKALFFHKGWESID